MQKGPVGYADEDSVTVAQKGRKEKGTYRPQIVSQMWQTPGGLVDLR